MKSKVPLALMRRMVTLLVLALAAALCLYAFVKSNAASKHSQDRERAVELARSTAEIVKNCGGDMEAAAEQLGEDTMAFEGRLAVFYDRNWQMQPPAGEGAGKRDPEEGYALFVVENDSGIPGLGTAELWVRSLESAAEFFRMEFAWQEVYEGGC